MRVLVQGPGAIGRLIAARFALAGIPTGLLDRDPERARFIGAEGLTLDEGRGDGARRVRMPVLCTEDAATGSSASPVEWDLLVVCVKAHDVAHAVATGRRRLTAPGRVLILSNGLGNLSRARRHCSALRLLGGTISCGARRVGIGGVACTGEGPVRIGVPSHAVGAGGQGLAAAGESAQPVVRLFRRAGFEADAVPSLDRVIWEKVAINCAINPMATLLGLRNGELPGSARFHTAVAAARETAFLACRHGVQIPTSGWKRRIGDICRATAANRCSMLEDLEAGRRTEIEALSGEVARRGERLCVGAPVNRTLATLVRSLERRTTGA